MISRRSNQEADFLQPAHRGHHFKQIMLVLAVRLLISSRGVGHVAHEGKHLHEIACTAKALVTGDSEYRLSPSSAFIDLDQGFGRRGLPMRENSNGMTVQSTSTGDVLMELGGNGLGICDA